MTYAKEWDEFPDEDVPLRLRLMPDQLRNYARAAIMAFGERLSDNLHQNINWDDDKRDEVLAEIDKRVGA